MAPPVLRTLFGNPWFIPGSHGVYFFILAPFHVNVKTDDAQLIYEAKL
jgi:hypothetical protein